MSNATLRNISFLRRFYLIE